MSAAVIMSNQSSGLLQASRSASGPDMSQYTYSMAKPSVNKHISKFEKTPFQGAAWGKSSTASLPPYGLIKSMMVKCTISFKPYAAAVAGGANPAGISSWK